MLIRPEKAKNYKIYNKISENMSRIGQIFSKTNKTQLQNV